MSFIERFGISHLTLKESPVRSFPALPPKTDERTVDKAVRDVAGWMSQPAPVPPTLRPVKEVDLVPEYVIPQEASPDFADEVVEAFLNGEKPPSGK